MFFVATAEINMRGRLFWIVALGWLLGANGVRAADWYVAPDGKEKGAGTEESPWDFGSTLGGGQKIAPGDTVWIQGGTYQFPQRKPGHMGWEVRLSGTEGKPIHVRARPGQRVTVDGGLVVLEPTNWLWLQDLEIIVSENFTKSRRFEEPGSFPQSYDRPYGGLNIYRGTGCKYINLVIHHNAQGVSFWREATGGELHGCIIYDNGWDAPDRGHGHGIYTQNETVVKTISDCILSGGYGYTLHAYGSENAYVDNYLVEGNILYDGGMFLIGGGRPSQGIRVRNNYLYNVPLQLGYDAPHNEDCEVRDNVIVNAGLSIRRYKQVVNEGNLVLENKEAKRPADTPARVEIRPNRYDANRFHVVVFNWSQGATVNVDFANRLQSGDAWKLLNPLDVYGTPVASGVYGGQPVPVPVKGEFAALVLIRTPKE